MPFTKAANPLRRHEVANDDAAVRIPFARRLPNNVRNHIVAVIGEYVGTVLFLFFALGGTQVANNIPTSSGQSVQQVGSNPQQLQFIALSFGFSLAVNAWVFFRISGGEKYPTHVTHHQPGVVLTRYPLGLFNPAVTFGMALIGALPWVRGVLLFIAQILGGLTAAGLIACMLPGPLTVQTALGGGTSIVQGLFLEMILTAELVFTIFMLAAEKHRGTFIAPVGIGLSLFVAELVGVYFTGGSLNPARSFGPAAVNRDFHGYHWIYWVGPLLGSFLAAAFYKLIKALEYETANPDQDGVGENGGNLELPTSKAAVIPQTSHSMQSFAGQGHFSGTVFDSPPMADIPASQRAPSFGGNLQAHPAAVSPGMAPIAAEIPHPVERRSTAANEYV